MGEFVVRPIQLDDLSQFVPLHQSAFAGSMGVELGTQYVTEFLKWFITYREAISLVCEVDGRLAGYTFGAPQGYNTHMNRDLLKVIAWAALTHPHLYLRPGFLAQIPERLSSLLGRSRQPSVPTDPTIRTFRMVGLGVSPDFRRRGIGQKLMTSFEERVWELGYEEIGLSVYETNTSAQALYKGCGWQPVSTHNTVVTYKTVRPK
jgi:ribosomal protein S18 acetylase RimI-like enzyme